MTLLLLVLIIAASLQVCLTAAVPGVSAQNCTRSDQALLHLKDIICASLGCETVDPSVTAQEDWPNQAIYYIDLLRTLTLNSTCLDTQVAQDTVAWLDVTDVNTSIWWNTWDVFQVQYYDMPRVAGSRIESPATLGRKCWAFAYLAQVWPALKPRLQEVVGGAGLDLQPMYDAYDYAVPLTMPLCDAVMANCFLNTTYQPEAHNGTCKDSIEQFYIGYQWENGNNAYQPREDRVDYPFPAYHMTAAMQRDFTTAANTVLDFII